MGTFQDITVHGVFRSYGTGENPVKIRAVNPSLGWGVLDIKSTSDSLILEHTDIQEGRIYVDNCPIRMNETHLTNNQTLQWDDIVFRVWFSDIEMSNSSITGSNQGEGLICHDCISPTISHCEFDKMPDAIEFINCSDGRINNSVFHDMIDDAIDLNNCTNILVDSNLIYNVGHRGLEIGSELFGSSLDITVAYNTIVECAEAINFKEGSTGLVLNNTLYQNDYAIATQSAPGFDQEIVAVENCIFAMNQVNIYRDSNSIVNTTYCCFTEKMDPGAGNFEADPMFIAPNDLNFHIDNDSPCVNSGSPVSAQNLQGPRSDVGAHQNEPNKSEYFHDIKVWPNPAYEELNIRLLQPYESMTMYDLLGNKILHQHISDQFYVVENLSNVSSGSYILLFETSNQSVSISFSVL